MRILLFAILTSIGCSWVHAESPKSRTELLSYGELMQLTPKRRIQYFSDLALLLALMEQKTERKYDLVALESLRRQRREVAWWLEALTGPEANAQDLSEDDVLSTDGSPAAFKALRKGPSVKPAAKANTQEALSNEELLSTDGDTPPALKAFRKNATGPAAVKPQSQALTNEVAPTETARAEPAAPPAAGGGAYSWAQKSLSDWYAKQKEGFQNAMAQAQSQAAAKANGQAPPTTNANAGGSTGGATGATTGASTGPSATPGAATGAATGPSTGPSATPGGGSWVDPKPTAATAAPGGSARPALTNAPFPDMTQKPANDVVDQCPVFPPKCEKLPDAKRKELILAFRAGKQYNKCIAGGYFSDKKGNRRAGSCDFKTKEPFGKTGFSCDDGRTALCNPMLFCLRYDNLKYQTAGKNGGTTLKQLPIGICVPRGQDVTRECYDRYNATLGIGPVKKRWDLVELKKQAKKQPKLKANIARLENDKVVPVACDFNTTSTDGLKEKYDELKNDTQKGYRELCELTPGEQAQFRELFCEECNIISKQLHATLTNAGHGCGPAVPIPHNGGIGPGSNGGTGATREY